ncbi:MAG: nucleotidyltransferase domain-containing protein [Nitrospirae bacterium]|nr:nucleotidyltransferase domain-containing protein [Nitrospirota bacterium]
MKKGEFKKYCWGNHIQLLVQFGSSATGTEHAGSDIDIAVLLKWKSKVSKLKLIYGLDEFFDGKKIDLVVLTPETDPLLLYEIFFRGRPLYESKKGIFINQKLRAWKLYLDTARIRRFNDKYLKALKRKVAHVA